MRFAILGSGSAGNATLVQHNDSVVLIDCGLSARQVEKRSAAIGFDIAAIDALLITHEHDDHVAGAATLAKRAGASVFASAGTQIAARDRLSGISQIETLSPGQALSIGELSIAPIIVPHDAREPCQFVLEGGGRKLGVLTDVGQVTPHLEHHYSALDGLILEFNHDPDLLATSAYPASLKQRIGGDYGHLSNRQAEGLLRSLDLSALQFFVAAHLSEKTNSPERVADCLARVLPSHVGSHIAEQSAASPWWELG